MGLGGAGAPLSSSHSLYSAPSRLFDIKRPRLGLFWGLPKPEVSRCGYYALSVAGGLGHGLYGGGELYFAYFKDSVAQDAAAFALSWARGKFSVGGALRVAGHLGGSWILARKTSLSASATFWPSGPMHRFSVGVRELGTAGDPFALWMGGVHVLALERGALWTPAAAWELAWRDGEISASVGAEAWWRGFLGLRAGVRPFGDTGPEFSVGFSLRTLSVEETDVEASYALSLPHNPYETASHWFNLDLAFGDALKPLKDSLLALEQDSIVKAKERWLEEQIHQLEARAAALEEEAQRLAKERESVEKMRREALEALKKIQGLKIQEEKEFIKITAGERAVHFASGSADLPVEGIVVLKKIARFLKAYPNHPVIIEGHTDNVPISPRLRSKFPDNKALSEARAKAVRDYFVLVEGLPARLFTYKGYGAERPIASNDTEEGRAKNRRVEIIIRKGVDNGD